jgi:hypothetical protein
LFHPNQAKGREVGAREGSCKASPLTNAAGQGSGPHCPQAAEPLERFRRFFSSWTI